MKKPKPRKQYDPDETEEIERSPVRDGDRPSEPPPDEEPDAWEKAFAGGKKLQDIHIEIEPANPLPPKKTPRTEQGVDEEAAESPSPSAKRPPKSQAPQPAVYELGPDDTEGVLDSSGHIDWVRAMSKRHLMKPSSQAPASREGEAKPALESSKSPAESTAPPGEGAAGAQDWSQMPGAEKVLKMPAGRSRKPLSRSTLEPTEEILPGTAIPKRASSPGAAAAPPETSEVSEPAMSRYEQLKRQPSFQMDPEAVKTANDFSEIMFHISRALHMLKKFRAEYPYLIAPNIFAVWEDNLKETSTTMLREFQHMKDPRRKQYDRKYVCRMCKSVFFVSLPDGICDECRGKISSQAPY